MLLKILPVAAGLAVMWSSSSFSQSLADLKPKQPIIPLAPKNIAWTVTLKYKRDSSRESAMTSGETAGEERSSAIDAERIVSVTTEKVGPIIHSTSVKQSGKRIETWTFNNKFRFMKQDGRGISRLLDLDEGIADYSQNLFEELGWITMETFNGAKDEKNGPVFVFSVNRSQRKLSRREATELAMASTALFSEYEQKTLTSAEKSARLKAFLISNDEDAQMEAILDAATQLPITFNDGTVTRSYKFLPPPSALNPPEDVVKALRNWVNALEKRNRTPTPP